MPDKALNNAVAKPNRVPRGFSLGSHRPTHKLGFSPWGMLFSCAVIIFSTTASVCAQTAPCGLTSVRETNALNYPPLMKVAHVQGTVVLLATFDRDGNVTQIKPISGPGMFKGVFGMLKNAATDFVQGWHANAFTGPRECPVVVKFELSDTHTCETPPEPAIPYERIDLQHVTLRARVVPLCDPGAVITRKHRFLIF